MRKDLISFDKELIELIKPKITKQNISLSCFPLILLCPTFLLPLPPSSLPCAHHRLSAACPSHTRATPVAGWLASTGHFLLTTASPSLWPTRRRLSFLRELHHRLLASTTAACLASRELHRCQPPPIARPTFVVSSPIACLSCTASNSVDRLPPMRCKQHRRRFFAH